MKPTEIISQNMRAHGQNPAQVLQWIAGHTKGGSAVLLQHEDSVLLIKRISPGEASLHLFTVDKPMALMKAIKDFVRRIKASDLKRVYGKADNPQITQALQAVGVNVQRSDKPQFNWMANVED